MGTVRASSVLSPQHRSAPGKGKKLSARLQKALRKSDGERYIARFLRANPVLVFWTFVDLGGHTHYVVPEFGLGKSLQCDFALLQSFSGGWNIHFVELEPVKDPLYNKDGTPSKHLRIAQRQIGDWRTYSETDQQSLRNQLADAAKPKYCLDSNLVSEDPSSFAGDRLRDPYTCVIYHYHIVIGRKDSLNSQANMRRSNSSKHNGVEIVTYDRFVEAAKKLDGTL